MSVSDHASQVPRAGNVYHQVNVGDSAFALLGNAIFNPESLLAAQREAREEHLRKEKEELRRTCHQALKNSNYEQQKNINPDRAPQTCLWVLDHDFFKSWRADRDHNLLWISADPGCGKSVLSKYLVDFWTQDLTIPCVCYYFFKDNTEQSSLSKALCAVLHQLFEQQPHLIDDHALPLWESTGQGLTNETTQLWKNLCHASTDEACQPITCVLDALDECSDNDRQDLIKFLCDHHTGDSAIDQSTATRKKNLKFLVTSRPYDNVRRWFDQTITQFPQIRLRGEDKNAELATEINNVIAIRVRDLTNEFSLSAAYCRDLTTTLLAMKNRTYLWLHLAIEDLRSSFCNSLDPEYEKIETVPVSVEDAYERILSKVDYRQKDVIRTIFKIMVGAYRPLTIEEMAVALAVKRALDSSSNSPLRINVRHLESQIRHWCALFVFIDNSLVHFIHQTAKEFLITAVSDRLAATSHWRGSFPEHECEAEMAKLTIEYLSLQRFRYNGLSSPGLKRGELVATSRAVIESSKFHSYCSQYWSIHARGNQGVLDRSLLHKAICLCCVVPKDRFEAWYEGYRYLRFEPRFMRDNDHLVQDQFVAIRINNLQVLQAQIEQRNLDLNAERQCGCTALMYAVACGSQQIVRWLLSQKVELNVRSHELTPLLLAVEQDDHRTAEALLDEGADINYTNIHGESALMHAIIIGNFRMAHAGQENRMAHVLLTRGASVETRVTSENENILHAAVSMGWPDIVEKLIIQGADVNMTDDDDYTALHVAVGEDDAEMVALLLDHGADINARTYMLESYTPLILAAEMDAASCAAVLLQRGADSQVENSNGYNALEVALNLCKVDTVAVLLKHGATINRDCYKLRYKELMSCIGDVGRDALYEYIRD